MGRRCLVLLVCALGACTGMIYPPDARDGGEPSEQEGDDGGAGDHDNGGGDDALGTDDDLDCPSCPVCTDGPVTSDGCKCSSARRTSGYCCGDVWQALECNTSPPPVADLVDLARVTAWDPGIDADHQLDQPLGADGLPVRNVVCATLAPGDNIQAAIDACPEGQVVKLAAGTFTVSSGVELTHGVVLRGSGSDGAPSGTTLVTTAGGPVISIGTLRDSICRAGWDSSTYAVVSGGAKEGSSVTLDEVPSDLASGSIALLDVVNDATVHPGDADGYFARLPGRSISQRVEVASIAGKTVTFTSPLHWSFPGGSPYHAELTSWTDEPVRYAGVEGLRIQGGTRGDWLGQSAGGIDISNAAYCWVKDVQTDENTEGMHIALAGTYRCVVRDSYVHHSADYGYARDCYGIVLRCGAADNLIENNIVRYMNKPILFNNSGGGNVVAYNYVDNSWSSDSGEFQELNIDVHALFPHMELIEGNYAPHMGAANTHGNSGYLTYFRNYSSSHFAAPALEWGDVTQTDNVAAIDFAEGVLGMNVIGNVLGQNGLSAIYEAYEPSFGAIYQTGGASDVSATSLYRHGNFDYVNDEVLWDEDRESRVLPPSLFRAAAPAWWPPATPWPWSGPDLEPMVGTLPAKARASALP